MGYRSNVKAVFYVTAPYKDPSPSQKNKAEAAFKFWWAANFADCPEEMRGSFKPFPEGSSLGYVFEAEDVKWYDGYYYVQWFNAFLAKYRKDLCDNDQLDENSGLDRYFAYESIRVGEDADDIEEEASGYADYVLSLERSIQIDFPQSKEAREKSVASLAANLATDYVINEEIRKWGQTDQSSLCPEQQGRAGAVNDGFKQVQLWHIHGITGEYFATKLAAEVRARKAFPYESPDRLYARVYFTTFFKES